MLIQLAGIAAGIAVLYLGGDLLVRHAGALARAWGLSPLVIGLTVVAFGTSAPELAASLTAALADSPEIALGNVVGSNIANIALILALAALVRPIGSDAAFLRRELPVLLGVSALLAVLLLDGGLGRLEGAALLVGLGGYLALLLRNGEAPEVEEEFREAYGGAGRPSPARAALGALAGLGLLVGGAQLLVAGATALARGAGVPELVIGLSLVAVGTSLPELATSLIAAAKGESEIALGNVVGSNVFNVLGILGATALARPLLVPFAGVAVDLAAMLATVALLVPFLWTGRRLDRREGAVLLVLYSGYLAALALR